MRNDGTTLRRFRMEWGLGHNQKGYVIRDYGSDEAPIVFQSDSRGDTEVEAERLNQRKDDA